MYEALELAVESWLQKYAPIVIQTMNPSLGLGDNPVSGIGHQRATAVWHRTDACLADQASEFGTDADSDFRPLPSYISDRIDRVCGVVS